MFNTSIAVEEFARLQREFGFTTCFETGTNQGVGTLGASQYCPIVATVEINQDERGRAMNRFLESGYTSHVSAFDSFDERVFQKEGRTIISMLGNSPEAMWWYLDLSERKEPFCFYLDAHWGEYWPILDELKVIADWKLSKSVIIVHDCRVPQEWEPGNGYGFDTYKGQVLDYDYLKGGLAAINPNYKIAYNKGGGPRGILYALP